MGVVSSKQLGPAMQELPSNMESPRAAAAMPLMLWSARKADMVPSHTCSPKFCSQNVADS